MDVSFDVIVVGAGHAGTEAALAASRLGSKTLLLTHNLDLLGQMSCNPSIGGIGKGHLVKEIDALDGVMALAADEAGIQFRLLNRSKGPAVRATRVQADRVLYRQAIRRHLQGAQYITLFQQAVNNLIIKNGQVRGVVTELGLMFYAKAVILTVGTFLRGKIHVGQQHHSGGRAGDPPAIALAHCLQDLGLTIGRLKTGTPPRIDGKTINYDVMTVQPGDKPRPIFSYLGSHAMHPEQRPCYITHTTEKTRDIILKHLHLSAMYAGLIEGTGPRYCPSIEDKMVRFSNKPTHQIFVEPEGLTTYEVYPNGISTSMPFEIQAAFVRSIKGFEAAHITRPGYAIEYDYFDPRELTAYLQTKPIPNLFFAGQINGTTGYEEAAAQGLIAGINAALFAQDKPLWTLHRHEAYIGVLIDDLVTQGTLEPYRMFTSRAEYRLMLREDNADARLTEKGYHLGCVSQARWEMFCKKQAIIQQAKQCLERVWIASHHAVQLETVWSHGMKASDLLKRPNMTYHQLQQFQDFSLPVLQDQEAEQIMIQYKYQGYIDRQHLEIERIQKLEHTIIPQDFNYKAVMGLSLEVIEKLELIKPRTIGQAGRIAGVTPAAIALLLVYLKKFKLVYAQSTTG